jgi:hydroxymethylpyrimidine/phosphomethylpyrimidine kinase
MVERPVVLAVAGSDSGGGAGIQADLRVIAALEGFGTTALTALTAQNLAGVLAVHPVPPDFVEAQILAVRADFPVSAVKTGMLFSAEIVGRVAHLADALALPGLVVDPVMVATSGARLLEEDAVRAYREALCPRARLVTPNLDEAAVFLGVSRIEESEMKDAAVALERMLGAPLLLKGGHLDGDPVDVLAERGAVRSWTHPRRRAVSTHGTGCMLSSAIATRLAHGDALGAAVEAGLQFVDRVLAAHAASGFAATLPPLASI